MKVGDVVIITKNPGFSTKNRIGWECEIVELLDEKNNPYLAVKDNLLVSWPLDENTVKLKDETWKK